MKISFLILVFLIQGCLGTRSLRTVQPSPISISQTLLHTQKYAFAPKESPNPLGSYVTMNVDHSPIADLRTRIEQAYGITLKHRGEAHITVITPREYDLVLSKVISMAEINRIIGNDVQNARFEVRCLGRGSVLLNGITEHCFYLVVSSADLVRLRTLVQQRFIKKGGNPDDFAPGQYYPHITIGFTKRDLYIQDGIIKNQDTCIRDIVLTHP